MAKIPILIIKSMGNASNIINSVFTIFFILASLSALNDNLQGFTPVIDENTGKMTGYKTAIGGADTVFPFTGNGFKEAALLFSNSNVGVNLFNRNEILSIENNAIINGAYMKIDSGGSSYNYKVYALVKGKYIVSNPATGNVSEVDAEADTLLLSVSRAEIGTPYAVIAI